MAKWATIALSLLMVGLDIYMLVETAKEKEYAFTFGFAFFGAVLAHGIYKLSTSVN